MWRGFLLQIILILRSREHYVENIDENLINIEKLCHSDAHKMLPARFASK